MEKLTASPPPLLDPYVLPPSSLEVAKQLADAASFFDCMKNCILEPMNKAEAIHHVETLHKLAMQIAGDRVDEVYAPDDGAEVITC